MKNWFYVVLLIWSHSRNHSVPLLPTSVDYTQWVPERSLQMTLTGLCDTPFLEELFPSSLPPHQRLAKIKDGVPDPASALCNLFMGATGWCGSFVLSTESWSTLQRLKQMMVMVAPVFKHLSRACLCACWALLKLFLSQAKMFNLPQSWIPS